MIQFSNTKYNIIIIFTIYKVQYPLQSKRSLYNKKKIKLCNVCYVLFHKKIKNKWSKDEQLYPYD